MILQKAEQGQREQIQAFMGCVKLGLPCRTQSHVGQCAECHVGSVEWCQDALGFAPVPDFHPDFLQSFRHRCIERLAYPCVSEHDWFVKPAAGYKIGDAKIVTAGETIPGGSVISEVVKFTQEWRYYVADGELLAAGWYDGWDEIEPAPKLDIEWPKGWCGAADFGRLDDGRIAVVEVHHPYACGNYLENYECETWAMWLELGWQWTVENR